MKTEAWGGVAKGIFISGPVENKFKIRSKAFGFDP